MNSNRWERSFPDQASFEGTLLNDLPEGVDFFISNKDQFKQIIL